MSCVAQYPIPISRVLADHVLESDVGPGRRMEQRLALVSRRPLRPGDEILAALVSGLYAPPQAFMSREISACC